MYQTISNWRSLVAQIVKKESACNAGEPGSILGWDDPLEKGMATHSSILAWEIPWIEESGRLWSTALQRVGNDLKAKQQQQKNNF